MSAISPFVTMLLLHSNIYTFIYINCPYFSPSVFKIVGCVVCWKGLTINRNVTCDIQAKMYDAEIISLELICPIEKEPIFFRRTFVSECRIDEIEAMASYR